MKTLEQVASQLGLRVIARNEPALFEDLPDTIDLVIDGRPVRMRREAGEPNEWVSDPLKVERDDENVRFEFVLIPGVRLSELHSAGRQSPTLSLLRGITCMRNLGEHGKPEGVREFLGVSPIGKSHDVKPFLNDAGKSFDKTFHEFIE
jgi:hypothetical protein